MCFARASFNRRPPKIIWKNFKKSVDKPERAWYYTNSSSQWTDEQKNKREPVTARRAKTQKGGYGDDERNFEHHGVSTYRTVRDRGENPGGEKWR